MALEARQDENCLIIARTDARTACGLDEAISRDAAFAAAGADVVFIESPESEDEFRRISESIDAPLLANMIEGGFSPVISSDILNKLGFAIVIYPGTGFMSVAALLRSVYSHLRETGSSTGLAHEILPLATMRKLMGFEEVWAFDQRWADPPE